MKKIRNFFWLCSGANRTLLEKSTSEASKYVGIGATVFFTGIFAALAGFYALYSVFDNLWGAAASGLLWGAMIFNLDRYIVSSMHKKDRFSDEFKMAIPRIILAILIAMVISKPLEMKIFEKEINAELVKMEQEYIGEREALVKQRFINPKAQLNEGIKALKEEIANKAGKHDELRRIARQEADGTGGTMRRNAGPIYRIKKADADRVEQEFADLSSQNESLINQNLSQINKLDSAEHANIISLENTPLNGLAIKLEALNRITSLSSAIWIANWFIILLFIAIETAPVVVKLLSPKGPYDYLLEAHEYVYKAESLRDMAIVNQQIKKKTAKMRQFEKDYVNEQLEIGLAQGR